MDPMNQAEELGFDEALGQRIQRAINAWTGQLVDVSGRNTLLCYKDLRAGTLEIPGEDEVAVNQMLGGRTIKFSNAFHGDDLGPAARRARTIRARAEENYEEKGLQTLFIAWGMATWTNTRSAFTPCAPILLRQAHLVPLGSAAEDFELSLPGEWEVNPTLIHVLNSDFQVQVGAEALLDLLDTDLDQPDPSTLFERLKKEAASIAGFGVTDRVVLANFSYAKLPMVNDLLAAQDLLARNALLCAIAGDADAAQELKERHGVLSISEPDVTPPADEFLVLDADSSQSYAINAVVGGADLVIDGPPGTGKSQTIANLIATLSARGKRVLFVAEKRAAIDAVLSRLEKVGLSDLVLDLHEGPGAKGKLARQFAKSLADASSVRPSNMAAEQEDLVRRRDALVRRTDALHRTRDPWDTSVYELQADLIGVPGAVQSNHRLGVETLRALSAETFRQRQADLEAFVGMGGLRVHASGSPWLSALTEGTITTSEQAAAVLEAMTTFTQHTLPQTTERIDNTLLSVGLALPDSVADWARTFELLHRTSLTLDRFDSSVFALDLESTLTALIPATSGGLGRFWHKLLDGKYKAAVRSVQECAPNTQMNAAQLRDALEEAQDLLGAWKSACTDDGTPRLPNDLDGVQGTYGQLVAELNHLERALGQDELEELDPEYLAARLQVFIADRETLFKLPELWRLDDNLTKAGLSGLVDEFESRNLTVDQAVACFRYVWRYSILDAVSISDPEVGTFDGDAYSRIVTEFRRADIGHIATTPQRIRRIVAERITAIRDQYPEESRLVTHEAAKKRRHVPVRLLFQQAPHVLTALKPCWAMSPLVVSQVLPLEQCFDYVIFDEASQVTPESAVGALMRAERAVVAGDPHQLPPTTFFASGNSDEDEEILDEDVAAMTKDIESLLDLMGGLLPPPVGTRRLNWHYRSRDERLIAFSNSQPQLYDWSLTTFPGAETADVISHELVPFVEPRVGQEDSVSDEVKAVVRAISMHARERPSESLGVITMGIKHMDRINEELRRVRQSDPELNFFLDQILYENEKFFVKNLERVQGDERDAILISIGYGKNPDGRMLYRFGPLNNKGGERRLNVAVTRARSRIGVISSFSSADMDPDRLKSDGAKMLRDYLLYVESGGTDLGERLRDRDPLNPFEQDVLKQLTAAGLSLECQVGCSGYWIDFAAKHPTEPGRYVLAIEADGVMYHSSATARDRDRLRQDHLERLGWRFHRIWSSDWFRHRQREIDRTVAAYKQVLNNPELGPQHMPESAVTPDAATAPLTSNRSGFKPVEANRGPITEYSQPDLVSLVRWIGSDGRLRTKDEMLAEAMSELGFQRRSSRIVAAFEGAIDQCVNEGSDQPLQDPSLRPNPPRGYSQAIESGATHDEAVAVANAGGDLRYFSKVLDQGASSAQVDQVLSAGGDLFQYSTALESCATHDECLAIVSAGGELNYLSTVIEHGATTAQALEMLSLGVSVSSFAWALKAGTPYDECIAIIGAGGELAGYATVVKEGATLDDALEILGSGASLSTYRFALERGASHEQCIAIIGAGGDLGSFPEVLEFGGTTAQAVEVLSRGESLYRYSTDLKRGATYEQCIAIIDAGGNLGSYGDALGRGATHEQILEALASGIDLFSYAFELRTSESHEQVMDRLRPTS
jgi:very-short-patch-repair endonuclease